MVIHIARYFVIKKGSFIRASNILKSFFFFKKKGIETRTRKYRKCVVVQIRSYDLQNPKGSLQTWESNSKLVCFGLKRTLTADGHNCGRTADSVETKENVILVKKKNI